MSTLEAPVIPSSSSKAPILGVIIMTICAVITGLGAGGLLSYLTFEVPYVKVRAFAPFLCGILGGVGLMVGGWLGKVRSKKSRVWVGLLAGAVMMYFSWVVYLNILLEELREPGQYVYQPTDVWKLMLLVNEKGVWEMFGGMLNGFGLTCFWILETVIMIVSFIIVGLQLNPPFCEMCNVWAKKTLEKPIYQFDPEDQIAQRIEEDGAAALDQLKVADPQAAHLVEVVVHQCPDCTDCNFLTLNHTPMKIGENGQIEKASTNNLVSAVSISNQDVEKVQKMSQLREMMVSSMDSAGPQEQVEPESGEVPKSEDEA